MSTQTATHTREECQAKDPATCKFHGNPLASLHLDDATSFNDALDSLFSDEPIATPTYQQTVQFPADQLAQAERIIERANRRLERAGVAERFVYDVSTSVREVDGENIEYANLVLNTPEIRIEGYRFVAAHEFTPNGKATSHYVTKDALGSNREIDQRCDHCGATRHRQRVYWVQDDEGEIKQIGSSCLKEFFGVKPNGLWALDGSLNFGGMTGGSQGSVVYGSQDLLATALADTDQRGFISRSAAYGNRTPTADRVMQFWRGDLGAARHSEDYQNRAAEILAWARQIPADTEDQYLKNLRTAASEPWVKKKHVPLVVSAIAARERDQERQRREAERAAARAAEAAAAATAPKDYYALKGEKIIGVPVKVIKSRYFPNDFNGMTMFIFETEDGHRLKWNSHNGTSFAVGDDVIIKGARVKDNLQYENRPQTVVSHVSFEE